MSTLVLVESSSLDTGARRFRVRFGGCAEPDALRFRSRGRAAAVSTEDLDDASVLSLRTISNYKHTKHLSNSVIYLDYSCISKYIVIIYNTI